MSSVSPNGLLVTTPSKLLSAPVNLGALREDAWRELTSLLETLDGSIILVLDPDLEPALRLVVVDGVASLRAHRVETLLTLEEPALPAGIAASCDSVLYITRPLPHLVRLVASQVRALQKSRASGGAAGGGRGRGVQCHLALSPRRTFLAESLLREEGVLGPAGADDTSLGSFASSSGSSSSSFASASAGGRGASSGGASLGASSGGAGASSASASSSSSALLSVGEFCGFEVLPVDDDLLIMPAAEAALGDVALRGDTGPIRAVAGALAKLQAAYGPFGAIRAKGALSGAVVEQLLRQRREAEGAAAIAGGASSAALGLLDPSHLSVGSGGAGSSGSASGGAGGAGGAPTAGASRSPGFNLAAAMVDTRTNVRVLGGGAASAAAAGSKAGGGAGGAGSAAATAGAGAAGALKASAKGEIDMCILLDRSVDWVTPLLSSLTYEALLHESALGPLRCGMITVDTALVVDPAEREKEKEGDKQKAGDKDKTAAAAALPPNVTLHVNSNLKMYADLRDCNIQKACPRLAARAREIQALRDSVTKSRAADLAVADIRSFVKKIPGLQADMKLLRILIALTEPLKRATDDPAFADRWQLERSIVDDDARPAAYDAIAAAIATRQPPARALRLLCLQAVVEGGLRPKQLDAFRRALVTSYGHAAMATCLRGLEALHLLREREGGEGLAAAFTSSSSSAGWASLRKSLCLTADEVDVEDPSDIHYVTSGTAPLSVRLIQAALCLPSLPSLLADSGAGSGAAAGAGSAGKGASTGAAGGGAGAASASPSFAGTQGWLSPQVAELLRLLPGPVWHVNSDDSSGGSAGSAAAGGSSGGTAGGAGVAVGGTSSGGVGGAGATAGGIVGGSGGNDARRVVLVVFVGGVTFSELSALRFVSQAAPVDFVVMATAIASGRQMLEHLGCPAPDAAIGGALVS